MSTRRLVATAMSLAVGGALAVVGAPAAATAAGPADGSATCTPTQEHRPICPRSAPDETAAFLDGTARVAGARHVALGRSVYVGPFATLVASERAPITMGAESNAQDNVRILAEGDRRGKGESSRSSKGRSAALANGLRAEDGVEIGERVILAHGATVKGPARLGSEDNPQVFLSFGSEVDGAVLEDNTVVSALGRVGPGVVLRSGTVVLPGKNVTTQREADDPALRKIRAVTPADVVFSAAVVDVNVQLAREYSQLARESRSNIKGINVDPGSTTFNPDRDLPKTRSEGLEGGAGGVDAEACDGGQPTRVPGFRNRIIGEVCLGDSFARLNRVMGSQISLRADEGEPIAYGHLERMGDRHVAHALEETTVSVGDGARLGDGSIIHGGGRRVDGGGRGSESTSIGDRLLLGRQSVVFRSLLGDDVTVGERSVVVSSEPPSGTVIPARVVWLNNMEFGDVEW